MVTRLLTFGVWALLAASAVFWGVQLTAHGSPVPEGVRTPPPQALAGAPLDRLLGQVAEPEEDEPEAEAGDARFQLLGVVSPPGDRAGRREGWATLATEGELPRTYRVGAQVADGLVLQAVTRRSASLGPRGEPATVTLQLPEPEAATPSAAPAPGPRPQGAVAGPTARNPGLIRPRTPAGVVAQRPMPGGAPPAVAQPSDPEDDE
jgi:general secretion pathway protein C